ncbi:UNVERIFIED_CONTAM: hypothetical protein FKN15_009973 [Acipenser sinensis]
MSPRLSVRSPKATSISCAVGFNTVKVNQFFQVFEEELKKSMMAEHLCEYGMWMSGIPNVQTPGRIAAVKGVRQVGSMTNAERLFTVTVVRVMSAAGQYVPPMMIFPRKRTMVTTHTKHWKLSRLPESMR